MTAPESVVAAAASGDRRRVLIAIRDELARALDGAKPYLVPRLSSELRRTLAEIAALGDPRKVSKADELVARREARLAKAASEPGATEQ